MEKIAIRVETEINFTESEEKVKMAVANIFGNISTEIQPSHERNILKAEIKGREALVRLRNLLRSDRIRDAARKKLFEGTRGQTIDFCLNKQVAFVGHISFSEKVAESPLGPIRVAIKCEDPSQLINWLAPRTA